MQTVVVPEHEKRSKRMRVRVRTGWERSTRGEVKHRSRREYMVLIRLFVLARSPEESSDSVRRNIALSYCARWLRLIRQLPRVLRFRFPTWHVEGRCVNGPVTGCPAFSAFASAPNAYTARDSDTANVLEIFATSKTNCIFKPHKYLRV